MLWRQHLTGIFTCMYTLSACNHFTHGALFFLVCSYLHIFAHVLDKSGSLWSSITDLYPTWVIVCPCHMPAVPTSGTQQSLYLTPGYLEKLLVPGQPVSMASWIGSVQSLWPEAVGWHMKSPRRDARAGKLIGCERWSRILVLWLAYQDRHSFKGCE